MGTNIVQSVEDVLYVEQRNASPFDVDAFTFPSTDFIRLGRLNKMFHSASIERSRLTAEAVCFIVVASCLADRGDDQICGIRKAFRRGFRNLPEPYECTISRSETGTETGGTLLKSAISHFFVIG